MNQKNSNKIWKCSVKQILTNGVMFTQNKNTFMWCNVKRTQIPIKGILKLLNILISKNFKL